MQLPAGNYEYLFLESGEPESFSPENPCTITCCGGQFTNRTLIVEDGVDQQLTFGWESCDETCTFSYDCPDLEGDFGDACDDGNPNTFDDMVRDNCTCAGTPVNDECVDAIDIVCGESYFGSTTYAKSDLLVNHSVIYCFHLKVMVEFGISILQIKMELSCFSL